MFTAAMSLLSKSGENVHYYIRKCLSKDSTRTLVHAFITARIDYGNGLLYGLPVAHLNKLQRIQNSAARLVCSLPRFCHILFCLVLLYGALDHIHIYFALYK